MNRPGGRDSNVGVEGAVFNFSHDLASVSTHQNDSQQNSTNKHLFSFSFKKLIIPSLGFRFFSLYKYI